MDQKRRAGKCIKRSLKLWRIMSPEDSSERWESETFWFSCMLRSLSLSLTRQPKRSQVPQCGTCTVWCLWSASGSDLTYADSFPCCSHSPALRFILCRSLQNEKNWQQLCNPQCKFPSTKITKEVLIWESFLSEFLHCLLWRNLKFTDYRAKLREQKLVL